MRAGDADLHVARGVADHGDRGHFRARARSCWNRNDRQRGSGNLEFAVVGSDAAAESQQQGGRLGQVQATSAADPDQHVRREIANPTHTVQQGLDGQVRLGTIVNLHGHPGAAQICHQGAKVLIGGQSLIGAHQCTPADLGGQVADGASLAAAERDAAWQTHQAKRTHQRLSPASRATIIYHIGSEAGKWTAAGWHNVPRALRLQRMP
jgi:hypothetical protein